MSNSADTDKLMGYIGFPNISNISIGRAEGEKKAGRRKHTAQLEYPKVLSQSQHLLIVANVPEALSFNQLVSSKPTYSPQKEHEKEIQDDGFDQIETFGSGLC
ncbi:hypothetical protein BU17DRAFT_103252 [Hysterangium stoloniferum]|nr:hypothetical protein BU17DRAFT_103252 [Hysterangium stoloniferum]